ncbi:patatin-like phospholipase family protein [Streptomyces cinnamoneus]|uniref:patatin-like phospholipase family protein n=1 Tax=Streptomyces cinnamoneus TaxID=53446 RepID=UPI003402C2D9
MYDRDRRAVALRGAGVDLAEADLFVGTSAGAIVGALLATGQDPDRLATPRALPTPAASRPGGHASAGHCLPRNLPTDHGQRPPVHGRRPAVGGQRRSR